jgi:hypothetical protein
MRPGRLHLLAQLYQPPPRAPLIRAASDGGFEMETWFFF